MSSSSEDGNTVGRTTKEEEVEVDAPNLPYTAAAVLEFVTPSERKAGSSEIVYITSKDALLWAGIASFIAHSTIERNLTQFEITRAVYSALANINIPKSPSFPNLKPDLQTPKSEPDYVSALNIGVRIVVALTKNSREYVFQPETISELVSDGFDQCVYYDLISDPVIETGLAVAGGFAILGFIPFNIVKRTKKGEVVYRKLQAALWKYERRNAQGFEETNITFAVVKIAKAIKVALVQGYHELAAEPGEEPDSGAS